MYMHNEQLVGKVIYSIHTKLDDSVLLIYSAAS